MLSKYKESIPKDILTKNAINNYISCNKSIFEGLRRVSFFKKVFNERKIRKLIVRLMDELQPYRSRNPDEMSSEEIDMLKKIFTSYILEVDKRKLFFDRPFLKFFLDRGYLNAAEEFIERAKKEDGNLSSEEIFQAIRNVWIMNSLQILWGIPVEITPSVYGYSMLYPYTDNFLDNPHISMNDKVRFNENLTKILSGEKIHVISFQENFAFGYGSFLQLLDDLQDAKADRENKHQTIFSIVNENDIIDDDVNRLTSYIAHVNSHRIEDTKTMTMMKEVISSCTLIMVMEAVGKQPEIISERLYRQLESYSKVRLKFYNEFEFHIKALLKEFDFSKPINDINL